MSHQNRHAFQLPRCLTTRSDGAVVLSGHRVKLHALMTCYRQRGSVDEVLQAFPTLSREVVEEVLEFAARKPDIVESILDEEEQRLREAAAQVDQGPSLAELRRRVPA